MNGSPRRNSTVRAMLVAVAIGAVVAGSATVATQLNASTGDPVSLASGSTQIANAEELPAPGHAASTTTTAPTSTSAPTTTATPTTTTSPTTTTEAPPTSTTTLAPPSSNPPPTAPSSRPATDPAMAAQVFQLVNQVREDYGCDALREDSRLDNAANGHSQDMAANNYFSHSGPGSTPFDKRIESYGYRSPGGENIAEGQTSAKQVFNAWMSDEGHRDNIMNCDFVAMGVGVDTQGWYWTQDFGY